MIKVVTLIIFLIVFIMHIIYTKNENRKGRIWTKPFLMPLLAMYYVVSANEVNKLIVIALLFGFIGDVFLMWDNRENNFLFGLGAFFLGHLCYVILFIKDVSFSKDVPIWFYIIILIYVLGAIVIMGKLNNYLGAMKIPAYLYAIVILLMSFTSLTRVWVIGMNIEFILSFIGTILFLCSDTILGFATFKGKFKYASVYIMITYVLAQALIVFGYLV
ncbi:MAG: lysoplasmalogenase [Clostridium sp.]